MVRAGKNSAQIVTRARILLKADVSDAGEGWSDSAIAAALDTSINNVARTLTSPTPLQLCQHFCSVHLPHYCVLHGLEVLSPISAAREKKGDNQLDKQT